jgi:hypothetical protein
VSSEIAPEAGKQADSEQSASEPASETKRATVWPAVATRAPPCPSDKSHSSQSEPPRASESQLTEAELEAAIVRAVTMGLGEVARTLAFRLDKRRTAPSLENVVDLNAARMKGH